MATTAISVIIPVSKDLKIKECLATIDLEAEIIVVLNNDPSLQVAELVRNDPRCHAILVKERGCNLARVFNIGIIAASNQKVVLMNSDCIFPAGLLGKLDQMLDEYPVVKAPVEFAYGNRRQKLVAECRRLFHQVLDQGRKLFGPGLAFRKGIKEDIGGYYFDETMGWGEDGEMSTRIRRSGLDILILSETVKHAPENIGHDWRVAFRIGLGHGLKEHLSLRTCVLAFWTDLGHFMSDHHGQFRTARKEGGWLLWGYLLSWKIFNHLGYYCTLIKKGD